MAPEAPLREEEIVGDRAPPPSFDAIYEEYFDFVWRSVARLGVDPSVVEDAAQDVFVIAHRRLPSFEGRSSVRTWLFGIAFRVAHDYRRAARRKRNHGIVPEAEADVSTVVDEHAPSPLDSVTRNEAVERLHTVLAEIDEERRAVFILVELEQIPVPEIAEALGTNVNTIYTRLRAARQKFNEAVERHRARDAWRQR